MEGINAEIKVPIRTNLTQLCLYGLLPQNPHPYIILSAENEIRFIERMEKLEKNEMDYVTSMTNQVNSEKQGENKDTIMQKWAEESLRYSESVNKLFSEFGFKSEYFVKDRIKAYFNENYLKLFHKINTNVYNVSNASVVDLAKALLVASAYLQTTDLKKIIDWACDN